MDFLKTAIGLGMLMGGSFVCDQNSLSVTLVVVTLQRQALDLPLIAGIG